MTISPPITAHLEQSHARPQAEVGAQEVEGLHELEPVEGDLGGRHLRVEDEVDAGAVVISLFGECCPSD